AALVDLKPDANALTNGGRAQQRAYRPNDAALPPDDAADVVGGQLEVIDDGIIVLGRLGDRDLLGLPREHLSHVTDELERRLSWRRAWFHSPTQWPRPRPAR